jgi:hypothetical protein
VYKCPKADATIILPPFTEKKGTPFSVKFSGFPLLSIAAAIRLAASGFSAITKTYFPSAIRYTLNIQSLTSLQIALVWFTLQNNQFSNQ